MRFGPDDEDAYYTARDELLTEFGSWLDLPDRERAGLIADVGTLLDWRYHHSSGVLDEFAPSDITAFVLEWCPRQLSQPSGGVEDLCHAVGDYVTFMADTGRLVGGTSRAALLMKLADDLAPTMRDEMANPANFGMGKSLLAGLELPSDASEEEIQAALDARMREINALPFEQRKALTDRFIDPEFEPDAEDEPYELPFVYIPPPGADVAAAVAESPLRAKVEALRDYLGPDGKALTTKGNLKLADGRALIELLGTGDEMDPQIGDKTWRTGSTADLRRLNFILDIAKEAGAVRVHQRRLVPVKAWTAISSLQQAAALFGAIIDLGPLESELSGRIWYFDEFHQLLDDGIVHWLAPLLAEKELAFDDIVEWGLLVVNQQVAPNVPHLNPESWEKFTRRDVSHILEVLEIAGVVGWVDRVEIPATWGRTHWADGTVSLTALGRYLLPDYLDEAGYLLRRADDVADGDGAALIEAMLSADAHYEAVLASWQADRPANERVQMLTEAIVASSSAAGRTMGFMALNEFDIEVAEPFVRQLLDTPVAGHAALWLIQRDRVDAETVAGFVDVAVLVDMLSSTVESPEVLCEFFTECHEPLKLLDEMWRYPAPETAGVLDTLGQYLPDKVLAKAARKAAIRHRSWLANR